MTWSDRFELLGMTQKQIGVGDSVTLVYEVPWSVVYQRSEIGHLCDIVKVSDIYYVYLIKLSTDSIIPYNMFFDFKRGDKLAFEINDAAYLGEFIEFRNGYLKVIIKG